MLQPMGKDGRPEGFVRVLWGTKDPTNKAWMETQTLYTYNKDHQVNLKYFSSKTKSTFKFLFTCNTVSLILY